jgi:hypothetical protein
MKEHPECWLKHTHTNREGRRYESLQVIRRGDDNKAEIVFDYSRFLVISEIMMWLAGEYIIKGWAVGFKGCGYLRGTEAKNKAVLINWKATTEYCKMNNIPITRDNAIFYTHDFYKCVRWFNSPSYMYQFTTATACRYATGLRQRFSRALTLQPELSNNYFKDLGK